MEQEEQDAEPDLLAYRVSPQSASSLMREFPPKSRRFIRKTAGQHVAPPPPAPPPAPSSITTVWMPCWGGKQPLRNRNSMSSGE